MKTLYPYLISAIAVSVLFSCGEEPKPKPVKKEITPSASSAEKQGVHFESRIDVAKNTRQIKKKPAYVYYDLQLTYENLTSDTIFYLSTTCSEDANLIRWKDKHVISEERAICNATVPKINYLAPHKKKKLHLIIAALENQHDFEYSFHFRKVDKSLNIDQMSIDDSNYGQSEHAVLLKNQLHPTPQD